jgi:uncharacterized protein YuzE
MMTVRYFPDTDTLLINFSDGRVTETRDLTEDVLIELDEQGRLVSMTIEHAKEQMDATEFTYQLATT